MMISYLNEFNEKGFVFDSSVEEVKRKFGTPVSEYGDEDVKYLEYELVEFSFLFDKLDEVKFLKKQGVLEMKKTENDYVNNQGLMKNIGLSKLLMFLNDLSIDWTLRKIEGSDFIVIELTANTKVVYDVYDELIEYIVFKKSV